jgi:hypothetical protein
MATTYTVTGVRKELSSDGTHRHIEGVCTSGGIHYTRKEVVDSINNGNTWETSADGYTATIEAIGYCPAKDCLAAPYIKTKPDSTKKDNLENLDAC